MSETQTRRRPPRAEQPEPEQPDENEQLEEEEPAPPAEPPAEPADPVDVQKRKIDNARRKYHRDLAGIVGDLEGAAHCPMCDGLGLVPSTEQLQHRADTERCPDCHGLGHMLTGSLAPNFVQLPCPRCSGNGYVSKRPENVHELPVPAPVVPQPAAQQVHGWFDPVTQTFHPYSEAGSS